MSGAQQRASDDDRQQVIRALERHTAAGRLSLDEYAERVDLALAARTIGQLSAVTSDLPPEPAATPAPDAAHRSSGQLLAAFLIALVALVVVAGLVALR